MNDNINNEVEQNSSASNTNQIFDLIQSIQSKLNNENSSNIEYNNEVINNENIQSGNIKEENAKNSTFDFSSLLNNIDLNNVLSSFLNQNSNVSNNNTNSINNINLNGIDPGMIMKFGNLFSSVTQDNPKRNLLLSLKPFLRKTRQDKLNEYVTILTIVDAIGIFNSKGSGK